MQDMAKLSPNTNSSIVILMHSYIWIQGYVVISTDVSYS